MEMCFIFGNSADPDEMPHYAAFHLDLHCLPKYPCFSDFLPAHPASFAHNFFLWDAKFLFHRVPGCNSIADLSLKQRVPRGLVSPKL